MQNKVKAIAILWLARHPEAREIFGMGKT